MQHLPEFLGLAQPSRFHTRRASAVATNAEFRRSQAMERLAAKEQSETRAGSLLRQRCAGAREGAPKCPLWTSATPSCRLAPAAPMHGRRTNDGERPMPAGCPPSEAGVRGVQPRPD